MRIALVIRPFSDENLMTARQMGIEDIVTVLPNELRTGPVWDYLAIVRHKKKIEDMGLRWSVVESVPISDRIKLGQEGRAIGFKGVIRPDHTPTFAIDKEDTGGYNFLGRLYAVGYMRGLMHGIG